MLGPETAATDHGGPQRLSTDTHIINSGASNILFLLAFK